MSKNFKIGLVDVDGHNFPSLPLMKLSAWHKAKGHTVEWYDPLFSGHMDKVYLSKVFSFTPDFGYEVDADEVVYGGTGYAITLMGPGGREIYNKAKDVPLPAEVEHTYPDYSLYGITDTAYGFLSRGCPRGCGFCHVADKEGKRSRNVVEGKKANKAIRERDFDNLVPQMEGMTAEEAVAFLGVKRYRIYAILLRRGYHLRRGIVRRQGEAERPVDEKKKDQPKKKKERPRKYPDRGSKRPTAGHPPAGDKNERLDFARNNGVRAFAEKYGLAISSARVYCRRNGVYDKHPYINKKLMQELISQSLGKTLEEVIASLPWPTTKNNIHRLIRKQGWRTRKGVIVAE